MDQENELKIWKKRIAEFELSSATIAEFSSAHGFSPHQYYYWKNKIITKKVAAAPPLMSASNQSQLIKVIPEQRQSSKLPDPVWLASFIKALLENS